MANILQLQQIFDHCQEVLAPIEPTDDYAKREHHRQEYLRSFTDLNIAITSAIKHATDLESAVAAAIQGNAQLGNSAQDLYRERSRYKVEELQARLHLTQILSNRHTVASEITYSDEHNPGSLESDYRRLIERVRSAQVSVDDALDAVLVATSKLTQGQQPINVPLKEKKIR